MGHLKHDLERQRDMYQFPEASEVETLAREYQIPIAKAQAVYADVVSHLLTPGQQLSADVAGCSAASYWNKSDSTPKKG